MREISDSLIEETRIMLGEGGKKFFTQLMEEFGSVSPVIPPGHKLGFNKIPYAVHFREGMQIRNFLRTRKECWDWPHEDLDNLWAIVIEKAIQEKS